MKFDRRLVTIFVIQTTEVLGFSLVLPYLPLLAKDLGASVLQVGLIFSTFSLFQFISAPIMGRLSDYYGRRPLLILSQISTTLGFLILAFATNLWMILLSRIVDGALGSNFTIAQAYLSDISTKKNRSKIFGLSGAAFGIGFLIGPAIGGVLAEINYMIPALLAASVAGISVLMTAFLLPETVTKSDEKLEQIKIIDIAAFKKYFSKTSIRQLIIILFSFLLAHQIWVSNLALFADLSMSLGSREIGLTLAYIGLISIIFRGILLSRLIDYFGEGKLTTIGFIFMLISLVLVSFSFSWWYFGLVLGFFAIGSGLIRPLVQGEISRSVSSKEQGSLLGITNSVGSITQIIGPVLGALLLQYLPTYALGLSAALIISFGLYLWMSAKK